MGDTTKKRDSLDLTMSLGDHLEELRRRLIYALAGVAVCVVVSLLLGRYIIVFLKGPFLTVMGDDAQLGTLAPAEGFTSYLKIVLISALVVSSPWTFYHLWMFVAAGLYSQEKRYVHMAVPFSSGLFITGAVFFLVVVAPLALKFFVKCNNFLGLSSNWTFPYYIAFVTHLMLVFGIAFQTPIAIFFLTRTGLVSCQSLRNSRKFVLLGIVVLAAIATPPDVISQVTLAVPLYLLYELGILLSAIADRKKK